MNISIDLIFNCLNIVVRVGLVVFIIQKYVVKYISQALTYEQQDLAMLVQQEVTLKKACTDLEISMKKQQQLYDDLQLKFMLWQKQVNAVLEQEKAIHMVQQEKMQQQLEKKQKYVHRRFLIEKELPGLLQDTAQNLQAKFSKDKSLGKAYTTKVLRALYE